MIDLNNDYFEMKNKTATAFLKSRGWFVFSPVFFNCRPQTLMAVLFNTKFLVFFFGRPVFKTDLPDCSNYLVVSMMVKATNFVSVDNVFPSVLLVCAAKISSLTKKVLPDHFYLFIAKIFQKKPNKCVIYFQITFFRLFCKPFVNQNRK